MQPSARIEIAIGIEIESRALVWHGAPRSLLYAGHKFLSIVGRAATTYDGRICRSIL
jgi:hypothetical protein